MKKPQPPATFPVATLEPQLICPAGPHAGQEISQIQLAENIREAQQLTGPQILDYLGESSVVQITGGPLAGIKGEPLAFEIRQAGKSFHVWTEGHRWRSWLSMAELIVLEVRMGAPLTEFIAGWRQAGARGCLALLVPVAGHLQDALDLRASIDPDLELPFFVTPAGRSEPLAGYHALSQKILDSTPARDHRPVCQIQLPEKEHDAD